MAEITHGYVKTEAEVKELQERLKKAWFGFEVIECEFETTEKWMRHIIPPFFEYAGNNNVYFSIGNWTSFWCGEFDCCWFTVEVKYKGVNGLYVPTLFVSGDMPVTMGNVVMGESKKTGSTKLIREGDWFYGAVDRFGRILECEVEVGPDQGPMKVEDGTIYEVKAYPNIIDPENKPFDCGPYVMKASARMDYKHVAPGKLTKLNLIGSKYDPLDTIPVVKLGDAKWTTGTSYAQFVERFDHSNEDEKWVKHYFGRNLDDCRLYPTSPLFREFTESLKK